MSLMTQFRQLALAIEHAQLLSRSASEVAQKQLAEKGGVSEQNTGWMPFNLFDFGALLLESWTLIPDEGLFLEVGAGAGPNMALAQALGLDVRGIEVNDAIAQIGRDAGLPIETIDAGDYTGYGKASAIWMNRPRRDRNAEAALEKQVMAQMAPGAVLICANLENRPPESWFIINDSWDSLRRGAWVKPHTASEGWA